MYKTTYLRPLQRGLNELIFALNHAWTIANTQILSIIIMACYFEIVRSLGTGTSNKIILVLHNTNTKQVYDMVPDICCSLKVAQWADVVSGHR